MREEKEEEKTKKTRKFLMSRLENAPYFICYMLVFKEIFFARQGQIATSYHLMPD